MICHGDELGRTQQGNNNVYCQDNELSWIDWDAARDNEVLTEFTVRPGWEGGNPRPSPPLHQKGLLTYGDFARKPAWADLQRNYLATKQFGP